MNVNFHHCINHTHHLWSLDWGLWRGRDWRLWASERSSSIFLPVSSLPSLGLQPGTSWELTSHLNQLSVFPWSHHKSCIWKKTRLLYCNTFCFCPCPVHHQNWILLKLYESLFNVQKSFVKLFVLFVTFHWIILYWWWLFINRRYVWVYYLLVQCFC